VFEVLLLLKKWFSRRDPDEVLDAGADAGEEVEVVPQPAKGREPGGFLSIARLGLIAYVASAAILAGLAFLAKGQLAMQVGALQQQVAAAQGERLVAEIAGRVQGFTAVIENAAAQPGLVQAMTIGDAGGLANRADALASSIPGALNIRLLAVGTVQPDETQFPRLGYAALDLAREAEKGARPPLEVQWFGSPDQHIAVAREIASPQQAPVGVLLASVDLKLLAGWIQAAVPAGGYAELRQAAGEAPLLIASHGDAARQGTPPTATVRVPGSTWELVYWLPTQATVSQEPPLGFLALFAAAGAALALVFAAFTAVVTGLVRSDLTMLVNYAVDLLNRKRDHGYSVRLREFRKAVQMLDHSAQPASAEAMPIQRPPTRNAALDDPMFAPHEGAIVLMDEGSGSAEGGRKG
jgi:hypothetical protein